MIRQVYIEDNQVITESYTELAARVFKVLPAQVTPDMVKQVRTMTFAARHAKPYKER